MREVLGGARIVALSCRSLARARRFWVERLGFAVESERPGRFVGVNLGNFRLRLVPADDARPVAGRGVAVTFRTRNLARTAKELADRGVAFESHATPDGDVLETSDPDGHRVAFVERL
jgi:catechol 2,3-dioxygenase-like lactoylglutathione lyase family enzyme